MALSAQQIKHFKARLDQIKSELVIANRQFMTFEQKKAALVAGEYTLTGGDHNGYSSFNIRFDKEDEIRGKNNQDAINAEYNKILDKLYLGNEEGLLDLLDGFRNFQNN